MLFLRRLFVSAVFCFLPALALYVYDVFEATEKGVEGSHAQIGYVIADTFPMLVPALKNPDLAPFLSQDAFHAALVAGGVMFGLCVIVILISHFQHRPDRMSRGSVFSRAFERQDKGIKYKRKRA
ncbi:MAG: hypothetical protein V4621_02220 [Pseudomonadota bacterium]